MVFVCLPVDKSPCPSSFFPTGGTNCETSNFERQQYQFRRRLLSWNIHFQGIRYSHQQCLRAKCFLLGIKTICIQLYGCRKPLLYNMRTTIGRFASRMKQQLDRNVTSSVSHHRTLKSKQFDTSVFHIRRLESEPLKDCELH